MFNSVDVIYFQGSLLEHVLEYARRETTCILNFSHQITELFQLLLVSNLYVPLYECVGVNIIRNVPILSVA